MLQVVYRTPRGINYRPKEQRLFKNWLGLERPWSIEADEEKESVDYAPYVEPLRDWFFFKGDRVSTLPDLHASLTCSGHNEFIYSSNMLCLILTIFLQVQVLVGKDAGKQGIIDLVIRERNWVTVLGLNGDVVGNKDNDGKIFSYAFTERPLLVPTQVALVDPGDL